MVQIGVNSEKPPLEGEAKQSEVAFTFPVDTVSDEEKEKSIEKAYKHVAGLSTLISVSFAVIGGLFWRSFRYFDAWVAIFFLFSWVCVYAFTLRKPEIRNGDHPNKKAVYLALAAWGIPLCTLFILFTSLYTEFPMLLTFVVPSSLALTWALKRFTSLQRLRRLTSRVHPLLLIPAMVALTLAVFQIVRIFVWIRTYGDFYLVGIPLALLILGYIHCNIEVCLRRSPSMSPVAITHQLFLDAPYFIKIFFEYFGVNTITYQNRDMTRDSALLSFPPIRCVPGPVPSAHPQPPVVSLSAAASLNEI